MSTGAGVVPLASGREKMTAFIYIEDFTKTEQNEHNKRVNIKFGGDASNTKFMNKLDEVFEFLQIEKTQQNMPLYTTTPTNGERDYQLCSGKLTVNPVFIESLLDYGFASNIFEEPGWWFNNFEDSRNDRLSFGGKDLSQVEGYIPEQTWRSSLPFSDFEECFLWVDNDEVQLKLNQLKDLHVHTTQFLTFQSFFFVNRKAIYQEKKYIKKYDAEFYPFRHDDANNHYDLYLFEMKDKKRHSTKTAFIYIEDFTKTEQNEHNKRVNIKFGGDASNTKFMNKLDEVFEFLQIEKTQQNMPLYTTTPTNGERDYQLCSGKLTVNPVFIESLLDYGFASNIFEEPGWWFNNFEDSRNDRLSFGGKDLSQVEGYIPEQTWRSSLPFSDFEECFLWVDNDEVQLKLNQLKDLHVHTTQFLTFQSFFFVNRKAIYQEKKYIKKYDAEFYPFRHDDANNHYDLYVFEMKDKKRQRTASPEP